MPNVRSIFRRFYKRKKRETPMQEITAPMMARKVIGCLNSQWEGRRMSIGVIAMMVDAMPAAVN